VPPWLRDRVPLVYLDGELVAVADLWLCEGAMAAPGDGGLRLEWQRP
jgi:tRNA(Ile)-lysidine synthase